MDDASPARTNAENPSPVRDHRRLPGTRTSGPLAVRQPSAAGAAVPHRASRRGAQRSARFRSLSDPESLRQFAQNVREGIYITTREGEILDANPAFLEIFGVASLAELSGYSAADLLVEPTRRGVQMALID